MKNIQTEKKSSEWPSVSHKVYQKAMKHQIK